MLSNADRTCSKGPTEWTAFRHAKPHGTHINYVSELILGFSASMVKKLTWNNTPHFLLLRFLRPGKGVFFFSRTNHKNEFWSFKNGSSIKGTFMKWRDFTIGKNHCSDTLDKTRYWVSEDALVVWAPAYQLGQTFSSFGQLPANPTGACHGCLAASWSWEVKEWWTGGFQTICSPWVYDCFLSQECWKKCMSTKISEFLIAASTVKFDSNCMASVWAPLDRLAQTGLRSFEELARKLLWWNFWFPLGDNRILGNKCLTFYWRILFAIF